jgi:hypothetical protein
MLQNQEMSSRQQALALSAVISHPAMAADPCILCGLALVCRTWREAVQQCSTCSTVVDVSSRGLLPSLSSLNSLVAWLQVPGHARLVDSLTVNLNGKAAAFTSSDYSMSEQSILLDTAQQLLQLSLQNSAAAAAPGAAAAAGALRISSFSTNYLGSPAVLAALPTSTLTKLDIGLHSSINGLAMAAALAQLTNLRDMRLTCLNQAAAVPAVVLSGMKHMQQLTSLQLHASFSAVYQLEQLLGSKQPRLQLPLQRLTLEDLLPSRQQQQQQEEEEVHLPLLQKLSFCDTAAGALLLPPKLQMSGRCPAAASKAADVRPLPCCCLQSCCLQSCCLQSYRCQACPA